MIRPIKSRQTLKQHPTKSSSLALALRRSTITRTLASLNPDQPRPILPDMASILRVACRVTGRASRLAVTPAVRTPLAAVRARIPARSIAAFSTSRQLASEHAEETFEEFTSRVENDFNAVNDVFELQVSCCSPPRAEWREEKKIGSSG